MRACFQFRLVSAIVLAACSAESAKPRPSANPSATAALSVEPPTKLGAFVGPNAVRAPEQTKLAFYGTDLGVSFAHAGELRILFGDTWQDAIGNVIDMHEDDSQAALSLDNDSGFPDGAAVEAYLAANDHGGDAPFFTHAVPPLHFATDDDATVAPIELFRGGANGQASLDMGTGKTVVTAFSNGRDGAFAIFRRDVAIACDDSDGTPRCADGYRCDEGLGFCSNTSGEYATPCLLGSTRCGSGVDCAPAPGGGLCQDPTSSLYKENDEDGRLDAVVIQHELGSADPERPQRYFTQPWITNKFTNPIAKTVADFDEARDPSANDYRPATGADRAHAKVLLWGRPHSVGIKAVGRDARLYFAYVDMPERSDDGEIAWSPRYLVAIENGRPRFSTDPTAAIAIDLEGDSDPAAEEYDVVDKMAISYLATLERWVMFYGGDFSPPVLNAFVGPNYGLVQRDPKGAIHARFARQPWGPWSAPVPALEAGNPDTSPPASGTEYASGGMLHHPDCTDPNCIPGTPSILYALTPYGFLYAPNIIEPWTITRENGKAVDVYWNVSSWNPYQVVLLRTRIRVAE